MVQLLGLGVSDPAAVGPSWCQVWKSSEVSVFLMVPTLPPWPQGSRAKTFYTAAVGALFEATRNADKADPPGPDPRNPPISGFQTRQIRQVVVW